LFGILANWSFAASAIFDPTHLLERELGSVNSTIWLFNATDTRTW